MCIIYAITRSNWTVEMYHKFHTMGIWDTYRIPPCHAMPCHNNKNCGKVTNQEANSFGVHQEDGYEDETRIDLRKNIRIRGMMKFLKHVMFTKKTWDKQALTSFRSIIDHNPKTIIKPFLLCNKFGGIKQIAKNLSVPLFCLWKAITKDKIKTKQLFQHPVSA